MKTTALQSYAPVVLRIGLSFVFLWFGINQLLDPASFLGYMPSWNVISSIVSLLPSTEFLIMINGSIEIIFGLLLLVGLFTRVAAVILALHLLGITIGLGYNDIAVRDVGLFFATISVFLYGTTKWSLDERREKVAGSTR